MQSRLLVRGRGSQTKISREGAYACLAAAAADLKSLSYEELEKLTERYAPDGEGADIVSEVDGEKVYISIMIQRFGRFRKRISVEMMLSVEGEGDPSRYPFLYFERFKSGRLYPSQRPIRCRKLFKVALLVLFGVIVFVVAVLIWRRVLLLISA